MIHRCENPAVWNFHLYGGRGIKVCARWRGSLANFIADMGPRPSRFHTLDRIDANGDYEKGNCRWATAEEQARNRRSNRLVTFRGSRMTLAEACELTGVKYETAKKRLKSGWDTERALVPYGS